MDEIGLGDYSSGLLERPDNQRDRNGYTLTNIVAIISQSLFDVGDYLFWDNIVYR